ncbi:MAG: hypothetical protein LAO31_11535 [Acidobacteriia bacterium]|nr:hypothetical protein [Terriglobia bacterium]
MARKQAPRKREAIPELPEENDLCRPEVIVDFVFNEGLLFISIKNIRNEPALKVTVKFDKRIKGLGGKKVISSLPLFRNIEFLAPNKEITTFLDSSASFFSRGEPTQIQARISYQGSSGKKYTSTISHNLEIYREIAYAKRLVLEP